MTTEKIKEFIQRGKQTQELMTFVTAEADGRSYTQRGQVVSFDDEFVEITTIQNSILIRISSIIKIKSGGTQWK